MPRHIALLAFALPLAACGDPAPSANTVAATNTATESGYIARVKALPQGQLRGVLFRAIRDGANSCSELTSFTARPDQDGKPVWDVVCADQGRWRVILNDDGTAAVTGAAPGRG